MPYDLRKLNYFFFQEASISYGNNYVVFQLATCLFCEMFRQQASYKVHPRTGQEGPGGQHMYSFTLPSTSALDAGRWSTPRTGRFTPAKQPVPIV